MLHTNLLRVRQGRLFYPDLVIADGAAAYWRFEETEGATVCVDTLGLYDGVYSVPSSQPSSFPGILKSSTCGYFDGSHLIGPSPAGILVDDCILLGTQAFCLEVWLRRETTDPDTNANIIYCQGALNAQTVLQIQLEFTTNQIEWYSHYQAGRLTRRYTSDFAILDTDWHHVVMQRYPDGHITMHLDTVLDTAAGADLYSYPPTVGSTLRPVQSFIGSRTFEVNEWWGYLDEMAIYRDVNLSQEQITAHYNAALGL